MIKDIQEEILRIKKEKDICILAHSYVAHEILEIADFTGDSYALSVKAAGVPHKNVIMCGVRFMAETCKILSPDKHVFLANEEAGCAMADMMDKELIEAVKPHYPDYTIVAYINTTAALKTICDVCVTSSSAVNIVNNIKNKNILFIPDCNLGAYVAAKCPDKNIKLLNGGCPVHAAVTTRDVTTARQKHPGAKLLVHPECQPEVAELADYVGSTSGIMDYARNSDEKEFIIGTELSIAEHLQYECPDKKFYPLTSGLVCKNMKLTTLMDVYNCVKGNGGEEIIMDDNTIAEARKCIDEMIRLSK
ncbi:MAG: quinolinate synthase NadA [Clostridiales bacterium]|nr:quinolinate synthase NadA [Clostridiales bacterium]